LPYAFVELLAMDELLQPNICPKCELEQLKMQRKKCCDFCGQEYIDKIIERSLESRIGRHN